MGAKRYSTEQIIVKLRQAEIEMGRGVKVPEVCRKLGISEQTFYRWRKRYGGLDRSEVRRLKALEQENARLKKLLAESLIDNAILKEAASGNFRARLAEGSSWSTPSASRASPSAARVGLWASPVRPSATVDRHGPTRGSSWTG